MAFNKDLAYTASWKTEEVDLSGMAERRIAVYLRAFLMFLLALQQVKFGCDTEGDARFSVVVWFHWLIMSHRILSAVKDEVVHIKRQAPLAHECTYPDFMKCKPLYFKGTKGVVELSQWFERIETVFRINNCTVENQIKFATCTLLGSALTWWNSHIRIVGHDVAYAMTWTNLKKMMTDKYCPRGEIKKLEAEMWNLKVKGTDVVSYNQRFQELALMCARMFPEEGIRTFVERQSENKRKQDDNQQQQNKKQNIGMAYTAGSGEKKPYGGSKPLSSKCNYHHDGQCAPKCQKCIRVGHLARDCKSTANANTANNQRGTRAGQKATCFECGAQGHFKRECPKLKNNYRGNQGGNGNASAKVYAVGHAGTNPDSNVVTGVLCLLHLALKLISHQLP
ncbi:putative reverse transcriptase domain-containing protein [Tanacetum coccineum]|uniref:Reverse transcriptase domain-containing protein n=1 Tax=Tanacetum coccineum TaxID=301880 RepID=A0ABQ4YRD0_9ASTR